MKRDLVEHLAFLFGETEAGQLARRLDEVVSRFSKAALGAGGARSPLPLTQRDILLITYADQVREPDAPPLRILGDFCDAHLGALVSGVHLLPFYPSSSGDGFSVEDYIAVDPKLGAWDDVRALGQRFGLMLDAVFNHASAQGEWFQKFLRDDPACRDFFLTVDAGIDLSQVVRPRALPLLTTFPSASGPKNVWSTFSSDQADLNFKNPEVLLAILKVLLFYVAQGARFVRLDAIAYLWKEIGTPCIHLPRTHRVVQLMRAVLDEVAPQVLLITETNVAHTENLSYFGDGTNEAQLVYNFALPPLVLHSLATGNARKLTRWAQSLALPSDRVALFNFLASHDGIGLNPVRGILHPSELEALVARVQAHGGFVSYKRHSDGSQSPYELNINFFDALSDPAGNEPIATQVNRFLAAHAILLALAGVPGIYFHSLVGSRGDRAGAEASGMPRRINRRKLALAEWEAELKNPASLRARVFSGFTRLLQARREHACFHPRAAQEVLEANDQVFAGLRILRSVADVTRLPFHRTRPSASIARASLSAPTILQTGPQGFREDSRGFADAKRAAS